MRYGLVTRRTASRSTLGGLGLAMAIGLTFTVHPAAQQAGASPKRLNQIIEQLEQGKPAYATEQWQLIEMEHGPYQIDQLIKTLGELKPEGAPRPKLTPVIRIPLEGDEVFKSMIKQVLDQGVMGVIVPNVKTKEQAQRIVEAMRYPPQRGAKYPSPAGIRGWGPTRATRYWGLTAVEYARRADVWPLNPEGELFAIAMIESREALKNISEILRVPGLGGILIGGCDLSLSLGVGNPGCDAEHAEVEAATETVAKACGAQKLVTCGSFQGDLKKRLGQGFRLFTRASTGR